MPDPFPVLPFSNCRDPTEFPGRDGPGIKCEPPKGRVALVLTCNTPGPGMCTNPITQFSFDGATMLQPGAGYTAGTVVEAQSPGDYSTSELDLSGGGVAGFDCGLSTVCQNPTLPACNMAPGDLPALTTCGPIGPTEGVWHSSAAQWLNKSGGAGACSDAIGCMTADGNRVTSASTSPSLGECRAWC
jgi:hypothetical protein